MTKFLDKSFSTYAPTSKQYADNWDAIFAKDNAVDEEERDYQRWLSRQPDIRQELHMYSRSEMELFRDVALIKERNEIAELLVNEGNNKFVPYGARMAFIAMANVLLKRTSDEHALPDTEKAPGPNAEEPFASLDVEEVTSSSTREPPQ